MFQNGITKYLNSLMKKKLSVICISVFSTLLFSCSSKSENNQLNNNSESYYYGDSSESAYESDKEDSDQDDEIGKDNEMLQYSECGFEDGTYAAIVDYSNTQTNYSAQYTLDIEVQDCQIVQINFPNDGYLDEDHISYSDIDENGYSSVEGNEGKTYEIQIIK
jgi:hypothetical protein